MADSLEQVLRLVADGHLSAEQAAPILDALGSLDDEPAPDTEAQSRDRSDEPATSTGQRANALRIEVTEDGRRVVNLRIPVPLGRFALERIPGLAGTGADLVREALAAGRIGPLVVLDDDGDGVRIVLE